MIDCSKCGICCTKLNLDPIYSSLDRGDGTCKFFDSISKLCSIFNERPDICNSKIMYEKYFSNLSNSKFIELNKKACDDLKDFDIKNKLLILKEI